MSNCKCWIYWVGENTKLQIKYVRNLRNMINSHPNHQLLNALIGNGQHKTVTMSSSLWKTSCQQAGPDRLPLLKEGISQAYFPTEQRSPKYRICKFQQPTKPKNQTLKLPNHSTHFQWKVYIPGHFPWNSMRGSGSRTKQTKSQFLSF